MSTSDATLPDAGTGTTADAPTVPPTPPAPVLYTVNRVADGAEVRAQLSLADAQSECATLNVQARQQVGITAPVYDARGGTVHPAQPIYGSMFQGQLAQYEVRSAAGVVV